MNPYLFFRDRFALCPMLHAISVDTTTLRRYGSTNAIDSTNQTNQRNLSRLPCLPHETLLLFHWGNVSVRGLPRSESVRDEMRPALWSVETTPWGAYSTGTKQTR